MLVDEWSWNRRTLVGRRLPSERGSHSRVRGAWYQDGGPVGRPSRRQEGGSPTRRRSGDRRRRLHAPRALAGGQVEQPRRVVAKDRLVLLLGQVRRLLVDQLPRSRPRGVRVRE